MPKITTLSKDIKNTSNNQHSTILFTKASIQKIIILVRIPIVLY